MSTKKYQSSAILIALALGVAVSGLIIGISVAMSQFAKMSAQARDGKLAYNSALSGIEDGLMRYRYAKANNEVDKLLVVSSPIPEIVVQSPTVPNLKKETAMSYNVSFSASSLTVGKVTSPTSVGVASHTADYSWLKTPGNALQANMDDALDINLKSSKGLSEVTIDFSSPFQSPTQPLSLYFTALNIKVVNVKNSAEEQTVWETTNTDTSRNSIKVDSHALALCSSTGSACHLRIRPQIGKRVNTIPNATAAGRIFGTGGPASKGKSIFYAIAAKDIDGLIQPDGNNETPGKIILTSVGTAGQAKRKIEARIDASSGNYLGLFDYGIYCGNQCTGL